MARAVNACRVCQRAAEVPVCEPCVKRVARLIFDRRGLSALWEFDLPESVDDVELRARIAAVMRGSQSEAALHLALAKVYREAGQARDALDEAGLTLMNPEGRLREEALAFVFEEKWFRGRFAQLREVLFKE